MIIEAYFKGQQVCYSAVSKVATANTVSDMTQGEAFNIMISLPGPDIGWFPPYHGMEQDRLTLELYFRIGKCASKQ